MHPLEASANSEMFQDILDLEIRSDYDENRPKVKSICFPSSAIIFEQSLWSRFDVSGAYAPNAGPESLTEPRVPRPIASVLREGQRVDILPRDLEALKLDPPSFRLGVKESGRQKIQRSMRTGEQVTLEPAEVVSFSSTFDFLLPAASPKGMQVTLSTAGPLAQRRPKLKVLTRAMTVSTVLPRFVREASFFRKIATLISRGLESGPSEMRFRIYNGPANRCTAEIACLVSSYSRWVF
jgi:hypothetical protein